MELARSLVARVRQYVGDRRHSNRQSVQLPLSIFMAGPAKNLDGSARVLSLKGRTLDISAGGLALIVPAIRVGEHHLIGESRGFKLRLDLPAGPVEMSVAPIRYESLADHKTESGFLIGVKIVDMPADDRQKYSDYFLTLKAQSGIK